MNAWTIRPAAASDLPQLTELYNHYVEHTSITFDLQPFTPEQRQAWFDEHTNGSRRIRLLVAANDDGKVAGYATTSRFRPKAAYDTTVEASVYCSPDCVGQGIGTHSVHRTLSIDCGRRHQPDRCGSDDAEPGVTGAASALWLH